MTKFRLVFISILLTGAAFQTNATDDECRKVGNGPIPPDGYCQCVNYEKICYAR